MLVGAVLAFVVVLAVYGLLVSLHLVPQPALLFGDGSAGLSRLVLVGTLLVKPTLAALTHSNPVLAVIGLIIVFGGGWLWWRLVRGDREGQEALG